MYTYEVRLVNSRCLHEETLKDAILIDSIFTNGGSFFLKNDGVKSRSSKSYKTQSKGPGEFFQMRYLTSGCVLMKTS